MRLATTVTRCLNYELQWDRLEFDEVNRPGYRILRGTTGAHVCLIACSPAWAKRFWARAAFRR